MTTGEMIKEIYDIISVSFDGNPTIGNELYSGGTAATAVSKTITTESMSLVLIENAISYSVKVNGKDITLVDITKIGDYNKNLKFGLLASGKIEIGYKGTNQVGGCCALYEVKSSYTPNTMKILSTNSRYPHTVNVKDITDKYYKLSIDNFYLTNVRVTYGAENLETESCKSILNSYNPDTGILLLNESFSFAYVNTGGYSFYLNYDVILHF